MPEFRDYEIIIELLTDRIVELSKNNDGIKDIINLRELTVLPDFQYKDLNPTLDQLQISLDNAQSLINSFFYEEDYDDNNNYNDDYEGETKCY